MASNSLALKGTAKRPLENRVTLGMLRLYVCAVAAIAAIVLSNVQSASSAGPDRASGLHLIAGWQALGQNLTGGSASGTMGIQINPHVIGQLRTELFVFAIMATGLISLYIRYRRQKPEPTVSVSGFYAE